MTDHPIDVRIDAIAGPGAEGGATALEADIAAALRRLLAGDPRAASAPADPSRSSAAEAVARRIHAALEQDVGGARP